MRATRQGGALHEDRSHRFDQLRRTALVVAVMIGVVVLVAATLLYGGAFPAAADEPHWQITTRIIEVVRDRSVQTRSGNIVVPPLDDERLVVRGAGDYAQMCAGCHGAPGAAESELRRGLNPVPPSLMEHRMDPRRSFWVIKHGLKMTAMPAWGSSHDDESVWSIVAFVDKLPGMTADDYRNIVARSPKGMNAHDMPAQSRDAGVPDAASRSNSTGPNMEKSFKERATRGNE